MRRSIFSIGDPLLSLECHSPKRCYEFGPLLADRAVVMMLAPTATYLSDIAIYSSIPDFVAFSTYLDDLTSRFEPRDKIGDEFNPFLQKRIFPAANGLTSAPPPSLRTFSVFCSHNKFSRFTQNFDFSLLLLTFYFCGRRHEKSPESFRA